MHEPFSAAFADLLEVFETSPAPNPTLPDPGQRDAIKRIG